MTGEMPSDPSVWRPMSRFAASISSPRQLQIFNDTGGISVHFDVLRSTAPDIALAGSQGPAFSFWETRSASGFVTNPKFNADLITIRFITGGHIVYRSRGGEIFGTPSHATLVGFHDLREVQASSAFSATSATIPVSTLVAAHQALTGGTPGSLPLLAPVAAMDTAPMTALYCTLRQVQRRSQEAGGPGDLTSPLIQEILGYQLLSAWPKQAEVAGSGAADVPYRSLRDALDYIAANLAEPLSLADIAAVAGISVRALQNKFRQEIGRTPVQFILDQRLARAHQDLISDHHAARSIAEIATRWGFGHMGEFARRYRRVYGHPPSGGRPGPRRRR